MGREVIEIGKAWESKVHFSLAVATQGSTLQTAGITARDADGELVGPDDIVLQTQTCFDNLKDILDKVGATWLDVVKYTIYTTDIEAFNTKTLETRLPYFCARPAATLVQVSRLVHPRMMVEIEAIVSLARAGQ